MDKQPNIPSHLLAKRTILEEANDLIHGDRKAAYGEVTPSFEKIAQLASTFINKPLDKFDICWIMIALKICRQQAKPKRDNLVDLAGYTGLMQQLLDEAGDKQPKENPINYEDALAKYLAERQIAQPATGVCSDYRSNAVANGWVAPDETPR